MDIFELNKYTIEQIRALKPKFELLKTYEDKLAFWDKHELNWHVNSYFFNEVELESEYAKPENRISIYPQNNTENSKCNKWRLSHVQKFPFYNIEKRKEKYFETIKNNPLPAIYTKQEIEGIYTYLKKQDEPQFRFLKGYSLGFQSVVRQDDIYLNREADEFLRTILEYAAGICDAHLLGFLEKQLQLITEGKQVLPDPAPQLKICDLTENCNNVFNTYVREFNQRKEKSPNLNALLQSEVDRLEAWRDNVNPPQTTRTNDGINLYPFFKQGWEMCIQGLFEYPNNGYKFRTEIIQEIETKYSKTPPEEYFIALSKVTTEEVIQGMAMAKYYFWLKDLQLGNPVTVAENETKFTNVQPLAKIKKSTLDQRKRIAREYLDFLSGCNIRNEQIMSKPDFEALLSYTDYLIEFEALPPEIKPIPQTGIPTETLRYTFYLVHKELYTTKQIKSYWIDFLHSVFKQFQNVEKKTSKTKFSVKPGPYDADMKQMKTK